MDSTWGPGKIIAGRYRLERQLGQGGMGSVWRAEHLTLRSAIAVKLIDPEIAHKPEMLERFQREAQAAATLRSPHVVQILDYGVDEGVPYIAMELLEGESLADRLVRAGRLPPAETARFVTHVARALARAHEAGIVHRDLKPDNVFLVRNDDQELAKVLDFGIAKHGSLGSGKGPTRTGNILGTPSYMSPEQAQGTKAVDGRSDLWSLGIIAYECLVGRVPFESEALGDLLLKICVHPIPVPSQQAPVPPGFDAWFARACCRDVAQRFQSAKELAEALRAVLVPDGSERASSGNISAGTLAALAVAPPSLAGAPTVAVASTPDPSLRAPGGAGTLPSAAAHPPGGTEPGMSVALRAPPRRSAAPLVAGAGLLIGALVAAWFFLANRPAPVPAPPTAVALPPPPPPSSAPPAPAATPPPVPEPVVSAAEPPPPPSAAPATTPAAPTRPRSPPGRPAPPAPPAPPRPPARPGDRLGF
jgi:serine/threonine-protein kinase